MVVYSPHQLYIRLVYGRYLQLKQLTWPLMYEIKSQLAAIEELQVFTMQLSKYVALGPGSADEIDHFIG